MVAATKERIWFHPPKFWAFTREMREDEVDQLFDRVFRLAERRDLDALKEFDFISFGELGGTEPS